MTNVRISRTSMNWKRRISPHPEAVEVDTGRVFTNTGEPITHWEIEVNSLEDLARISASVNNEELIISFGDDGKLCSIEIYDYYRE